METIPEARRQVEGSNIRAAGGSVDVSPQGAALVGSASEATPKATSAIGQIADIYFQIQEKKDYAIKQNFTAEAQQMAYEYSKTISAANNPEDIVGKDGKSGYYGEFKAELAKVAAEKLPQHLLDSWNNNEGKSLLKEVDFNTTFTKTEKDLVYAQEQSQEAILRYANLAYANPSSRDVYEKQVKTYLTSLTKVNNKTGKSILSPKDVAEGLQQFNFWIDRTSLDELVSTNPYQAMKDAKNPNKYKSLNPVQRQSFYDAAENTVAKQKVAGTDDVSEMLKMRWIGLKQGNKLVLSAIQKSNPKLNYSQVVQAGVKKADDMQLLAKRDLLGFAQEMSKELGVPVSFASAKSFLDYADTASNKGTAFADAGLNVWTSYQSGISDSFSTAVKKDGGIVLKTALSDGGVLADKTKVFKYFQETKGQDTSTLLSALANTQKNMGNVTLMSQKGDSLIRNKSTLTGVLVENLRTKKIKMGDKDTSLGVINEYAKTLYDKNAILLGPQNAERKATAYYEAIGSFIAEGNISLEGTDENTQKIAKLFAENAFVLAQTGGKQGVRYFIDDTGTYQARSLAEMQEVLQKSQKDKEAQKSIMAQNKRALDTQFLDTGKI